MDIHLAIASVQADAARIARYTDRRDRFLDALDWSALDEQTAREAAMLDDLLAGAEVQLSDEILDRIDEIVPPGVDVAPLEGAAYVPPAIAQTSLRRKTKTGDFHERHRTGRHL